MIAASLVGLAVAAVRRRGVVHGTTGNVEQILVAVEQQCDQERGAARVQIDRPLNRAAVSLLFDCSDQVGEGGFIVDDPLR